MVDTAVQAARLDMVFSSQPLALAVSVVLAAITVLLLLTENHPAELWTWFAAMALLSTTRAVLYYRYRHARDTGPADLPEWERKFHAGCVAAGVVWGSLPVLFFPENLTLQAFMAFVIAGISAGAMTELAAMPRTARSFVIPCVLPLAVRFFMHEDTVHLAMGTMACLYAALLVFAGRRAHKQLIQTVVAQLDATASRRALSTSEANLHASEERLRLATEAGHIGVWDWDIEADVLQWDNRMYEIYSLSPQDGSPDRQTWRQRINPGDLERLNGRVEVALAGRQENYDSEFRILWPDGQERSIKSLARITRNAHGKALRMTGINLDITELKRVERLKSEFVSIVSHELRTPLTAIRGALGMLAHHAPDADKTKQLLQLADRNAERLAILIDDLLDLEKLESGKLKVQLERQSVLPLIAQSVADNSPYAAARSVALKAVEPLPSGLVDVDAKRFLQVMANLISNAIKFSSMGSSVEVAVLRRESRFRVEVRDRGPGIPLEFQPKIFGKFCQADASDSRARGGTGLGLAICKTIVEQMNGTIGFETRPGQGTTFFFELPEMNAAAG